MDLMIEGLLQFLEESMLMGVLKPLIGLGFRIYDCQRLSKWVRYPLAALVIGIVPGLCFLLALLACLKDWPGAVVWLIFGLGISLLFGLCFAHYVKDARKGKYVSRENKGD